MANLEIFSSPALNLTQRDFFQMVSSSRLALRYGSMHLFNQLRENEIPMVIVSGGVKSIIDTVLEQTLSRESPGLSYQELLEAYNLHVLSNTFVFESKLNPESGKVEPMVVNYDKKHILHSQNKNDFVNKIAFNQIKAKMRPNVILLGDITADCDMVSPSNHDQVLNIGFLNKDLGKLESYLDRFEVVITGDGPMVPVNVILDQIVGNNSN